jgi:hypothetical protein
LAIWTPPSTLLLYAIKDVMQYKPVLKRVVHCHFTG